MVLDTHAGIGIYDLQSPEALKTKEAQAGVLSVIDSDAPSLQSYLSIVRQLNKFAPRYYPGSPEIVRRLLRASDRLIACELHPIDVGLLRKNLRDDPRVAIHHRNGYEAVRAFCPPPERRGLVFIDPPFERLDEFDLMLKAVTQGMRKWPTGIFAAWYPIKGQKLGRAAAQRVLSERVRTCLVAEFLPFALTPESLAGSGLVICNAPWRFEEKLANICAELFRLVGSSGGTWSVDSIELGS
ncbi:hypothetical protein MCBRY_001466 [Methylocystis bryophila]